MPEVVVTRPTKILRRDVVLERVGLSYPTVWRMERRGEFPKALKLSPGRVGYRESDVEAWITQRQAEAR